MIDSHRTRRRFLAELAATSATVGLVGCSTRRRVDDQREVERVVAARPSRDGAGVKLRRALGADVPMLDPFLLLDEIRSSDPNDFMRGFPTHPHRGFETVSYLISGRFEHADSTGTSGVIAGGDVQWMTAGRGIVHSEMPRTDPGEELWGLQLWVNLPAVSKMTAPRYQEIGKASIPELDAGDARVRLVAGALGNTRGPIDGIAVAPTLIDVDVPAGGVFRHSLPAGHTVFAYQLAGSVQFGRRATAVTEGHTAVFSKGAHLTAASEYGGRFLLFAGAPIDEPVARRGPFVMNTQEELRQAFEDYRNGTLVQG